jgi:hypothetical protein
MVVSLVVWKLITRIALARLAVYSIASRAQGVWWSVRLAGPHNLSEIRELEAGKVLASDQEGDLYPRP